MVYSVVCSTSFSRKSKLIFKYSIVKQKTIFNRPSSSEDENLPSHVYEAERNGFENQCNIYDADCPKSILDFVAHTVAS